MDDFLTKTERKKCKNMQNILLDVCYSLRRICNKKSSIYILKQCRDSGQCFKESLQEGNVVKNLEIVWMNNKTIEFSFHMLWRIIQISIRACCSYSSNHTQPHSIILLSLTNFHLSFVSYFITTRLNFDLCSVTQYSPTTRKRNIMTAIPLIIHPGTMNEYPLSRQKPRN